MKHEALRGEVGNIQMENRETLEGEADGRGWTPLWHKRYVNNRDER